jgi:hypothetical protein
MAYGGMVEALCYKLEGQGIDSQQGCWISQLGFHGLLQV